MKTIKVYQTSWCPYCERAKRLLARLGVTFEEIDVSEDRATRAWLAEVTGRRTVPQIFIDDEPIGGFKELETLERSGTLADKLKG